MTSTVTAVSLATFKAHTYAALSTTVGVIPILLLLVFLAHKELVRALGRRGVTVRLQAFDIAFNTPIVPGGPVSFMVNNHQWAVYGTIAVLVGAGQIVWSNSRRS